MEFHISNEIKAKIPNMQLGILTFEAINTNRSEALWAAISSLQEKLRNEIQVRQISQIPPIQSARKAYKTLGKDPARYRLSAEALMRRTLKGDALYQISSMVDFINYISLKTGMSIGGYDVAKIEGDVALSIGESTDEYEGVGRGCLNIEFLPVLRDALGGFGSPTSDSVRTSIDISTNSVVMVLFDFEGSNDLQTVLENITFEVEQFFATSRFEIRLVN